MVESFFKYSCRLVILRLCTLFMRIVPFRVSLSVLGTVTKPLISGLFCAYKTLQNKIWVDGPSVKGVAALTDMKMFFRKVFWVCIVINFCVRQITDYKFNSNFLPVSGYSFLLPIFKLCLVNFLAFLSYKDYAYKKRKGIENSLENIRSGVFCSILQRIFNLIQLYSIL